MLHRFLTTPSRLVPNVDATMVTNVDATNALDSLEAARAEVEQLKRSNARLKQENLKMSTTLARFGLLDANMVEQIDHVPSVPSVLVGSQPQTKSGV